jgi:glycosyltransferase involved in cell wall biosynthesis
MRISAVLITYNEADRLAKSLAPLGFCDEILVVDSGSTDGTQALAEQMGANVLHRAFDGFGPQKAYAVAQAKNNWVLCLDADEYLTPELAQTITTLFANGEPKEAGYRLRRRFFFLGKELKRGGETRHGYIRLFNKQKGNYNQALVHEHVELDGNAPLLPGYLLHESYRNLQDYLARFNTYTSQGAAELFAKGKKGSWVQIYLRFPINFARLLFGKGLIFDGYPGWIWAFLSSVYPVVKYAKLRELWAKSKA